jgi:hypothetical protein
LSPYCLRRLIPICAHCWICARLRRFIVFVVSCRSDLVQALCEGIPLRHSRTIVSLQSKQEFYLVSDVRLIVPIAVLLSRHRRVSSYIRYVTPSYPVVLLVVCWFYLGPFQTPLSLAQTSDHLLVFIGVSAHHRDHTGGHRCHATLVNTVAHATSAFAQRRKGTARSANFSRSKSPMNDGRRSPSTLSSNFPTPMDTTQ